MALNYALGRQAMAKGVTSYDDDVWIVSYPKSGNTWTRFLIANLIAGGETVDWSNIERRVPDIYYNRDPQLLALPRPRYFKSHEAYRPDYRRVVFIVRDPRDVAVSYYHFVRKAKMLPVDATMDDFMTKFMQGQIDPYGNWGENVGSWLGARRGTANFIVVRYEDLLENTETELGRIADMLGLAADERLTSPCGRKQPGRPHARAGAGATRRAQDVEDEPGRYSVCARRQIGPVADRVAAGGGAADRDRPGVP